MAQDPLIELLPNRVRRNYSGGRCLDVWEQIANPKDGNRPEDWMASTTLARNAGMPEVRREGLGLCRGSDGKVRYLADLFHTHGEFYLGLAHLDEFGPNLGYLAKLLDTSMRLHTQVHPTREMALEKLGQPFGKLECYVILGVRSGFEGNLRLGFQHAPSRQKWYDIVSRQDIAAMDACFEPFPVEAGQVWFVPGGLVHALGAGLLLLEVMEPSDLVVRCEFEREGILTPPDARFMGQSLEYCLDFFDYTERSAAEIERVCRVVPERISQSDAHEAWRLLAFSKTRCFEIWKLLVQANFIWYQASYCRLVIVVRGAGKIALGSLCLSLVPGSRFFVAADSRPLSVNPYPGETFEFLICQPRG
jgi:mannose-6-phosphate isomerase